MENLSLTNLGYTTNQTNFKTNMDSVKNIIKKSFWPIVAIANILIITDILLFSGANLLNILFTFTGGYSS